MTPFGPGLWLLNGPVVTGAAGFRFPTRMAAIRLPSGALAIWSPVSLREERRGTANALGPVRHLVAPNGLHYLFLAEWAAAHPGATIHAAPGLTEARAGVRIDAVLGDEPHPAWDGAVEQVVVRSRITTEVVFFHRESRTVLVADLIQHMPRDWFTGWRAAVARVDLMTGPAPAVPRKFRLALGDRGAARRAVSRVLEWPVERLVIAHGPPVEHDARAMLRDAFAWLMR